MSGVDGATDRSALPGIQSQFSPDEIAQVKQQLAELLKTMTVSQTDGQGVPQKFGGTQGMPELESPVLNIEDMTRALMELQTKLQDEQVKGSKEDIKTNMAKKEELHQERLDKIREYIDKMGESKKSGTFGKVFGWIATAAMCIAAVALIATGVGAVAGACLIGAAALSLTMSISGETGNWLNEGIASIFKAMGCDEKVAMILAQVTLMVAMIALSAGAAVAAAPAAGASATAGVVSTANTATTTATKAMVIATKVAKAAQVIGGLAQVGGGASGIGTAVITKEAEDARADSLEIQAFMQRLQMMMEDEMKRVKELLQQMQEGVDIVMQIMSGQMETKSFLAQQQGV